MAAVTSAWNKPGAWALDSEQNESELIQTDSSKHAATPIADFPSLSVAATTKTKKKKPQTISLSEFTTFGARKAAERENQPKGLTPDEILVLPTGPRERSAEELDRSKLGGGFRSYGGDREPRRGSRDSEREFTPSRADETDNWATGKKSSFGGGERKERGGFFTDSGSRADEVDNWGSKKSFVASEPRKYDRRGSFGLESSGGADGETWGRKSGGGGGAFDSLSERRGDSDTWGRKREDGGENGGGGGSARPRLNLQPRTKPIEEIVVKKPVEEVKSEVVEEVSVVKERVKGANPFGAARPREEVLKEKGQDWKEIEEKFDSVKVTERGAWSGRDKFTRGGEKAWRKPESVVGGGSRAQSDAGSENAGSENGHAENTENGHADNTENGHAVNTENGHAEDGETQM